MKIKLIIIILLISFAAVAQSVTITPSGDTTANHSREFFSGSSQYVLHLKSGNNFGTGLSLKNSSGYGRGNLMGSDEAIYLFHPGGDVILRNNYTPDQIVKLHANGNFGVGNITTPSAGLHVKEFSKLGEDAPSVKMKKFTGTTPPNQGFCTTVSLGDISHDKVLQYKVLVNYGVGQTAYVPEEYSFNPNYRFSTYLASPGISVCLPNGNSSNLISKSFKVLVTYEE